MLTLPLMDVQKWAHKLHIDITFLEETIVIPLLLLCIAEKVALMTAQKSISSTALKKQHPMPARRPHQLLMPSVQQQSLTVHVPMDCTFECALHTTKFSHFHFYRTILTVL